jgi:hypothetical protein
MSALGFAMVVISVLTFAWLARVITGRVYPNGIFRSERTTPPFWFFIGCSAIFTGTMFQLYWTGGLSPIFLALTPLGILILVAYRFTRKPAEVRAES